MFSKISKKMVAVTLASAVVVTSAAIASPSDASAAKLKINKKSVTLVAGKEVKLSVNAKAKWSTSNKAIATVSGKGKKCTVKGVAKGSATITAKAGGASATCKVKVNPPKAGTVIYDLAKESGSDSSTGKSFAAPVKCPYTEFKYSSFSIWLCRAVFYDPANGGVDYRGKKINISVTLKNSGKNDLAELAFCFNCTSPVSYPFVYHVIDTNLRAKIAKKAGKSWDFNKVKNDDNHKKAKTKTVKGKIKKGKTYTYNFSYTIPSNAMNGDKDPDTNINYPIMFYIPNLKDNCPYQPGDEITVTKAKFTLA